MDVRASQMPDRSKELVATVMAEIQRIEVRCPVETGDVPFAPDRVYWARGPAQLRSLPAALAAYLRWNGGSGADFPPGRSVRPMLSRNSVSPAITLFSAGIQREMLPCVARASAAPGIRPAQNEHIASRAPSSISVWAGVSIPSQDACTSRWS